MLGREMKKGAGGGGRSDVEGVVSAQCADAHSRVIPKGLVDANWKFHSFRALLFVIRNSVKNSTQRRSKKNVTDPH